MDIIAPTRCAYVTIAIPIKRGLKVVTAALIGAGVSVLQLLSRLKGD